MVNGRTLSGRKVKSTTPDAARKDNAPLGRAFLLDVNCKPSQHCQHQHHCHKTLMALN